MIKLSSQMIKLSSHMIKLSSHMIIISSSYPKINTSLCKTYHPPMPYIFPYSISYNFHDLSHEEDETVKAEAEAEKKHDDKDL
jgi:hypothetical protein